MKKILTTLFLWTVVFYCYSQVLNPVLSDALLLSKGEFEITGGYSSLGLAYDGEVEEFLNGVDFQFGYGISNRVNIIARYQTAWYAEEISQEGVQHFLFAGPEIQFKEDRISFYLPLGTRLSSDSEDPNFEITPTFKFSIPISKKIYFNPSAELGLTFCELCTDKPYLGIDLALGVRLNDTVSFFGEYDHVYSFEDFGNGHFYMIAGGVAFAVRRKE